MSGQVDTMVMNTRPPAETGMSAFFQSGTNRNCVVVPVSLIAVLNTCIISYSYTHTPLRNTAKNVFCEVSVKVLTL